MKSFDIQEKNGSDWRSRPSRAKASIFDWSDISVEDQKYRSGRRSCPNDFFIFL